MMASIYRMTLKSFIFIAFLRENVKTLTSFMQCYNGRHYITFLK